jgi:hypothetical protein
MEEENQCCGVVVCGDEKRSLNRVGRQLWNGICRWIFLYIWCRYCYRRVMRFIHRFNIHYAPPTIMSPKYGKRDHWCQWCGLRGNTWTHDPSKPLTID